MNIYNSRRVNGGLDRADDLVRINGLRKSFGAATILNGIDLTVKRAEA